MDSISPFCENEVPGIIDSVQSLKTTFYFENSQKYDINDLSLLPFRKWRQKDNKVSTR